MSGHSQFANIKHRKDAQDNKRGKIFQKITKEIYVAVKSGGSNPDSNSKLRLILEKARSLNMPKDNIMRAISKASNQNDNTRYEEVVYEGYGPASTAFIVHCLTDNKNRTASNIRSYFTKTQGKLGTSNSVQYLFNKIGIIEFSSDLTVDEVLEIVLDFDLFDLVKNDNIIHLEVKPADLSNITKVLNEAEINNFTTNGVENIAIEYAFVDNQEDEKNVEKLLVLLDDDDDVQLVETNFKK